MTRSGSNRAVMSEKERVPVARTVLQQCLHAKLQVKPAEQHSEAQFVEVRTEGRVILCPSSVAATSLVEIVL